MSEVYVIKAAGYYKIGYSKNLGQRLATIKTCNPTGAELVASWDVAERVRQAEKRAHLACIRHQFRDSSEWYEFDSDDQAIEMVGNAINEYSLDEAESLSRLREMMDSLEASREAAA